MQAVHANYRYGNFLHPNLLFYSNQKNIYWKYSDRAFKIERWIILTCPWSSQNENRLYALSLISIEKIYETRIAPLHRCIYIINFRKNITWVTWRIYSLLCVVIIFRVQFKTKKDSSPIRCNPTLIWFLHNWEKNINSIVKWLLVNAEKAKK